MLCALSRDVYRRLKIVIFPKFCHITIAPQLYQRRHASDSAPTYFVSPDFPPVYAAQQLLETVHTWTHLPWWVTIIGTTVFLRTVITVPLAVHQHRMIAKMELLQPTLKEISDALKHNLAIKCHREGQSAEEFNQKFKKEYGMIRQDMFKREGCNPLKMVILPWTQLPLWICLSLALRNMTGAFVRHWTPENALCPDLITGGVLWFSNLTVPDSTLILPFCVGLFNLTNIEMHALKRQQATRGQRILTNTLRCLSVGMIIVSSQVPSAMTLYWAVSAGFGVVQNVAIKFPAVRRTLGIPVTPSESKTPFQDLAAIMSVKAAEFVRMQREDPWKRKK